MYAAQNAQNLGTQVEIPENRPTAHRLGFQTFKAKTILQRLNHGEKLSPEDFFTLRKSLKKILRIIQEIDVNEELPENSDSIELRNMLTKAARNMVAFLSTDSPDIRTIQKDIFQINSLIPFTPQQVSITPEPASAPSNNFPQKEKNTSEILRNMSDKREATGIQMPRPAGASPMKNITEQDQRRSNPGRGQLESTRRSIKNALYTMRDVMQDDDMTENMQNSFQEKIADIGDDMIEYLNTDNQNMQLNLELNDKIEEVLEDIRKTVEVENEQFEEISNQEEDEVEQEEEEDEVDPPLFIPAMSAGPETETATQQNGSIPGLEIVTSIPTSQPFVQSNQELTPEFQEKKIKSLEDRFKCHLQEKINILKDHGRIQHSRLFNTFDRIDLLERNIELINSRLNSLFGKIEHNAKPKPAESTQKCPRKSRSPSKSPRKSPVKRKPSPRKQNRSRSPSKSPAKAQSKSPSKQTGKALWCKVKSNVRSRSVKSPETQTTNTKSASQSKQRSKTVRKSHSDPLPESPRSPRMGPSKAFAQELSKAKPRSKSGRFKSSKSKKTSPKKQSISRKGRTKSRSKSPPKRRQKSPKNQKSNKQTPYVYESKSPVRLVSSPERSPKKATKNAVQTPVKKTRGQKRQIETSDTPTESVSSSSLTSSSSASTVVTKKLKKSPKKMSTRSMRVQNSISLLNIDNIRDIEAIHKVRN